MPEKWKGYYFLNNFREWLQSLNDKRAYMLIAALNNWVKGIDKISYYGSLLDKSSRNKKVYTKQIGESTMNFIKSNPYISRVHCYDIEKERGTLKEITLNEEMCKITNFAPYQNLNLNNEQNGFEFCDLLRTTNYMDLYTM